MLDIYAGKNASSTIKEQGISQELFINMLGASGGPKWFTLFGLDKYLFGEFFKGRKTPLNLIGSSAGAYRFAALCQKNPVDKISQLAKTYAETTYSSNPKRPEITSSVDELLDQLFGPTGITEILNNEVLRPHFIVTKCKGLTAYENKLLQGLGLGSSIGLNRVNRNLLNKQYQRFIFHSPHSSLQISDDYNFNTQYVPLSHQNLSQSLSASGAIPFVMEGIKDIQGAPKGMYRDGGIIDYHFDVNLHSDAGLTLYPHFNNTPKPGWFDKNLDRSVDSDKYKNTIMLVPSTKFVSTLPFGKIPDRNDFTNMESSVRIKYWKEVLDRTKYLADAFDDIINNKSSITISPI
jgi:hypothetical protein